MEEYGFNKDLSRDELAVSRTQGIIFEECQYLGVDAIDYITKFMHSSAAEELDKMQSGVYSAGSAPLKQYILKQIEPVEPYNEKKHINEDALNWLGYIYRYWVNLLGVSSKELIDNIPVDSALAFYPAYHCIGNKEAISHLRHQFGS